MELFIGLLGAAIGVAGGVVVAVVQMKHDSAERRREESRKLAEQRRLACVDLLSTTRRLRQITLRTFQKRAHENAVDEIYAEMYRALYNVKALCPKRVADLGQAFFDQSVQFWRIGVSNPDAPEEEWQAKRAEVKESVQAFRAAVRQDFATSMGEDLDELDYA